ncbi:acyl carrier protein [Micromonospora sp. NBC_01740]|uniref:acyl carrier protein n=1 Tax=Micromonospora sp. NBC_01740 TaxID=2975986 RepID=UPI002E152AFC|nr:acyl carrier protein [Micromonospora sp. NBC_01740]
MQAAVRSYVRESIEKMTGNRVPEECDDDTPLGYGGLELESLYLMELTVQVEREYGVNLGLDLAELPGYTIGDLVRRVSGVAEGRPGSESRP